MGIPIKITWSFVAQAACVAIEMGVEEKGRDEFKQNILQMGAVADIGSEAIQIIQDLMDGTRMELDIDMKKRIETLLLKVTK